MTNRDILRIAMAQSAIDSGCNADDFLSSENKIVLSKPHADARRYLTLPFFCDFTSYGSNIVASVAPEISSAIAQHLDTYDVSHCFETPNLYPLNEQLRAHGYSICFMAEYFLPDVSVLQPLYCQYQMKVMHPSDFADCYLPQWGNALSDARPHLDTLGVGAFNGDKLIGLAACSADCDTMWQIGVDVLPEYRKKGVASALTSRLAIEILDQGRVPFYCCAWSNVGSARNAIKSGFKPAWVQITAKSNQFIAEMNR